MILKILNFLKTAWFWFLSGLILLVFFILKGHSFSQVFYFISFLLPVVMGTAYYINKHLIPSYLLRDKYALFFLYSFYTLIISLYLQYLIIYVSLIIFSAFQENTQNLFTIDISNLNLVLYLLILVKALVEIIQKLQQKDIIIQNMKEKESVKVDSSIPNKITVRYNRTNYSIDLDNVLYIESLSDYIKIVLEEEEVVTKERISKIIDRLPHSFGRTHRSFIVNTSKIKSYNKESINLINTQIPISRTYKENVLYNLGELM